MSTNERTAVLLEVADIVGDLHNRPLDDDDALRDLIRNAPKFVPGAQFAGITLVTKGGIETLGPSHGCVAALGEIVRKHREGPCLSIGPKIQLVQVDDLATENRWTHYRDDALELTTIRSSLSIRLFTDAARTAALNFYAEAAHAFDDDSVEFALMLASHTTLVWEMARRNEQFHCALASRDIIGQAKGMLMERFDIDAVEAFELLKRLSQSGNTPVATIAHNLVYADHPPR